MSPVDVPSARGDPAWPGSHQPRVFKNRALGLDKEAMGKIILALKPRGMISFHRIALGSFNCVFDFVMAIKG